MTDIVAAVIERIHSQQRKGLAKYGVPVTADTHSLQEWIEHEQQELTDALIYLECIKQKQTLLMSEHEMLLYEAEKALEVALMILHNSNDNPEVQVIAQTLINLRKRLYSEY